MSTVRAPVPQPPPEPLPEYPAARLPTRPGPFDVPPGAAGRPAARWHHSLDLIVRSLLEILVIAVFVVTFVAEPFRVPSASMQPTLRVGDMVLADKQAFADEGRLAPLLPRTTIRRGDLAVFHFPPEPSRDLVKRVVGLPGDRVRLRDGRVLLNGQALDERYAFYAGNALDPFRDDFPFLRTVDPNVDPDWWRALQHLVRGGEIVVPPGSYFVLGDNRNDSEDSRYWGFVPRSSFEARPLFVYLGSPPPEARTPATRLRAEFAAWRILR